MHSTALRHLTITRLVPPVAGGRWLCALGIFLALTGTFWVCGVFAPEGRNAQSGSYGAALFFSVVLAYTVPVLHFISSRTAEAIAALLPLLHATAVDVPTAQLRVWRKPKRWFVWVLGIGVVSGLAHNLLLLGSARELVGGFLSHPEIAAVVLGTSLTWIIITLALAALLDNARLLAGLGRVVRIDLLQPQTLRPFGGVAVLSTLMVVGAMAAFPIMFVDRELSAMAYVPGLIAMGVPMLLLALLPVLPLHKRLSRVKAQAIAEVNRRISAAVNPDTSDGAVPAENEVLATLAPLLTFRQELAQASEWPVDIGVVTRLGFYLIIPPLTWVGAALIEKLLDTVF
jgi:hypothetical protein